MPELYTGAPPDFSIEGGAFKIRFTSGGSEYRIAMPIEVAQDATERASRLLAAADAVSRNHCYLRLVASMD